MLWGKEMVHLIELIEGREISVVRSVMGRISILGVVDYFES